MLFQLIKRGEDHFGSINRYRGDVRWFCSRISIGDIAPARQGDLGWSIGRKAEGARQMEGRAASRAGQQSQTRVRVAQAGGDEAIAPSYRGAFPLRQAGAIGFGPYQQSTP